MDPYQRLKGKLPAIAKAVNEFKSEQVQQQVFRALLNALGVGDASGGDDGAVGTTTHQGETRSTSPRRRRNAPAADPAANNGSNVPRRRAAGPSVDKALDLRPAGKQSFKAFAEEKKPSNFEERNLIAVYYLSRELGLTKVSADQVYTCYMDVKWRVPTDLRNSLSKTTVRGWLDTSAMDDLKLTMPGQNHVLHDLPATKA